MKKKSNIESTETNEIDEFIDDGIDYSVTEYKASKALKNVYDIFEAFTYAIVVVILLFTFFIRLTIVDGPSMNNTLQDGNYLVVANVFFTYEPENGDIVVIHGNFKEYLKSTFGDDYGARYAYAEPIVKRVIATGGQTLKIDFNTNEVFVNNVKVNEDYIKDEAMSLRQPYEYLCQYKLDSDGNYVLDPQGNRIPETCYNPNTHILTVTIPKGHIFVMGDNRNDSADSRLIDIGLIPEEFIVGKVIFRISPFTTF